MPSRQEQTPLSQGQRQSQDTAREQTNAQQQGTERSHSNPQEPKSSPPRVKLRKPRTPTLFLKPDRNGHFRGYNPPQVEQLASTQANNDSQDAAQEAKQIQSTSNLQVDDKPIKREASPSRNEDYWEWRKLNEGRHWEL